ncbi:hypothetical protein FYK55_18035 [Roseiconus nitratireducens]|uniref:DUF3352 domain-containing protein n=1 Tax=Roseiconus nitratireducens TaxID=2605748 RepID=A0A5M6D295_9BACT|nr:hypothetical protein [Roseiconus nitratireducens]KAA5541463.1 hypothetical protein FYK55_18035 [Roseiconus nitratireducens]
MKSSWLACGFVFPLGLLLATSVAAAESEPRTIPEAAQLLPPTVVAYAQIPDLSATATELLDHPLRQRVEALPAYGALRESEGFGKLSDAVAAFEASLGMPWRDALSGLTSGGIHFALDRSTEGVALLIRADNSATLERFRGFVLGLAQMTTGRIGPLEQGQYRGITAQAINANLKMAQLDDWLLVTNKSELGKRILDQYLDGGDDNLASSPKFRQACASIADVSAWGWVDVQAFRDAGIAPRLYEGKTDNPLAEVLAGGILSELQHTPFAVATINVDQDGVAVNATSPHRRQWQTGREYFFGTQSDVAPPLLHPPDRLFAASLHRDLSQMWLRSGDLMTEKANEGLAKADTQLTTFFSGRDFGEDILGSLRPDIQLVVTVQDFQHRQPQPAIKLPAFALKFQMKDPERTRPEFRRVFQSFIGFLNVVGAMDGQPQFDLGSVQLDSATLITATYVPQVGQEESTEAPINFNFSPTLGFAGPTLVLSSTTELAHRLVQTVEPPAPVAVESDANTAAILNGETLKRVLEQNRAQLVAQNMLEKGHAPAQAEAEIGTLLDLVSLLRDARVSLIVDDDQLRLSAAVRVDSESQE